MEAFGIDIGGTGIKGAPVDLKSGKLIEERFRVLTPKPATPNAVAKVVDDIVNQFGWRGPIGCTFPAIVQDGVTLSASHVGPEWIGIDAERIIGRAIGQPVVLLNDADAAGMAEIKFGAGKNRGGVVLMLTFGSGVGSALFIDGLLVPNMQLGNLRNEGKGWEQRVSEVARERQGLSWRRWAKRVNQYLEALEDICVPDLIIIGGGVSDSADKFIDHLSASAEIVAAKLRNDAGIIGAAMAANENR